MGITKTSEKIANYQIAVSRNFQSNHPKKGEETNFVEKIEIALNLGTWSEMPFFPYAPKIHTCRANYPLWEKRMKKVQSGRAVIDLFYWKLPGGRFTQGNTKVVFATLDKDSGCGVQELSPLSNFMKVSKWKDAIIYSEKETSEEQTYSEILVSILAKNDGLSLENFESWFKNYDLSESMAIIQFTKFRY